MKSILKISLFTFMALSISACSSHLLTDVNSTKNLLKTNNDLRIEKILTSGTWKYERQADDCKDTNWQQIFYSSRYYESVGAACLVPNVFTVGAENWHLKNQILYITNLSPDNKQDIIIKYGIDYLDQNKLVLSSGQYQYTFTK